MRNLKKYLSFLAARNSGFAGGRIIAGRAAGYNACPLPPCFDFYQPDELEVVKMFLYDYNLVY